MKALLLAAGLGSRLRPLTDKIPKALVKVNNRTLLETNLKYLARQGITEIIINVHHFAEQIIAFLQENRNFNLELKISDEREMLLDTGGAVKKAAWFFNDGSPLLVYNVDVLTNLDLIQMLNYHERSTAIATLAVSERRSNRYLLFDEKAQLCGWRNLKTGEEIITRKTHSACLPLAFSGIQILSPQVLELFPEKNVFSLVELYLTLAREYKITCFRHSATRWRDVGKIEDLTPAELRSE